MSDQAVLRDPLSPPFDTKVAIAVRDDLVPVLYARGTGQSVPIGFKGVSTFLHFRSAARATSVASGA